MQRMRLAALMACLAIRALAAPSAIQVNFRIQGVDWLNVSRIVFGNESAYVRQAVGGANVSTTMTGFTQVYFRIAIPNLLNATVLMFQDGAVFVKQVQNVQMTVQKTPKTLLVVQVQGLPWRAISLQDALAYLRANVTNTSLGSLVSATPICPLGQFLSGGGADGICQTCSQPAPGQFVVKACAAADDAVMSGCRVCAAGQYDACPCGVVLQAAPCLSGDRVCYPIVDRIGACPPGFLRVTGGRCVPVPCPPGTSGYPPACSGCRAGTYKSTAGTGACLACAAGLFSGGNASNCSACGPGTYQSQASSTRCLACAAGTYQAQARSMVCNACPRKTFGAYTRASACATCPAGLYANGTGWTRCLACPAGRGLDPDAYACTLCRPGTYWQAGGCQPCAQGMFATGLGRVGATVCRQCANGSFTLSTGATLCFPCEPGTFGQNCGPCPAGTYQGGTGATSCEACSAGTFSAVVGASSSLACVNCARGTFWDGARACKPCPPFTTSPAASVAGSECRVQAGYYARRQGDAPEVCPANHYCPLGTTQPAPCPPGTMSAAGASVCSAPENQVVLFEVVVLILWAGFFVLSMWVCLHAKIGARHASAAGPVIRLHVGR